MLILIERAELSQFLTNFRAGFAAYEDKLEVLGHSPHDPEDLYSEPLIFMDQSFDALSAMLRGVGTRDQYELGLLERISVRGHAERRRLLPVRHAALGGSVCARSAIATTRLAGAHEGAARRPGGHGRGGDRLIRPSPLSDS